MIKNRSTCLLSRRIGCTTTAYSHDTMSLYNDLEYICFINGLLDIDTDFSLHPICLAKKCVDRNPNFEHWLLGRRPQQGLQDQIIKRITMLGRRPQQTVTNYKKKLAYRNISSLIRRINRLYSAGSKTQQGKSFADTPSARPSAPQGKAYRVRSAWNVS